MEKNNENNEVGKKDKKTKKEQVSFALGQDFFKDLNIEKVGKRLVVSAIFYSFPSNLNASGGTGLNIISQKIIPWGEKAEPRIYVSPYALKRRIRDYWVKKGQKVFLREDAALNENLSKGVINLEYIDIDLFGYMETTTGKSSVIRPGAITTWGAVSCEPLHNFIDFNTNLVSTTGSQEGGSIINRSISKEFYFTSFFINLDMIGVNFLEKRTVDNFEKEKEKRLMLFFEALDYAMQKDSGGSRDRPACVFKAVEICEHGYGKSDKEIFKTIKVENDVLSLVLPNNVHILSVDERFVKIEGNNKEITTLDDLLKKLKH